MPLTLATYFRWVPAKDQLPLSHGTMHDVGIESNPPNHRDPPPVASMRPVPGPRSASDFETPPLRWISIDLRKLRYAPWKEDPWYDRVVWTQVMEFLREHVVIGSEVTVPPHSSFDQLPQLLQEGVWSMYMEPLGLQPGGAPLGGGHRMLAMRRQGLTEAYGMT